MDYINSGYYIKIAEAEYAYLKGEKKRAYDTLLKIETVAPLINIQTETVSDGDIQRFVELSLLYKNYPKAYEYIYKLIDNHGYKINDFEKFNNFKKLQKKKFYNADALMQVEKNFMPDTALWQQIMKIFEADQYYKNLLAESSCWIQNGMVGVLRNDSLCNYYATLNDSIDNYNYYKLLNIIETKGYPLSKHIKYTWKQRQDVESVLGTMSLHITDSFCVEKMKNIFLKNIKTGDCPPFFLANLIDQQCRLSGKPFIYGIFSLITSSQIYDVENLDKRRAEIGLPSHKLLCEMRKIRMSNPSKEFLESLPEILRKAFEADCDF
jgi:hypothetical protein